MPAKNKITKLQNKLFISVTVISIIAASFMFGVFSTAMAADVPKIRDLQDRQSTINNQMFKNDFGNIYKSKDITKGITKKLEKNINTAYSSTDTKLKGGVSELKAIVGKSQLVKFDEPVKRISIAESSIADLVFISPKEMLVNGKTGGETSLIIWGETGEPVIFNLLVYNDSINFLKEIKKIAPNEDIKIDFINTGGQTGMKVMVRGRLSSVTKKERLEELAKAYGYSLIDMTEALTPQVMLAVKVVEINRTKVKNKSRNSLKGPLTNEFMTNTFGITVSTKDETGAKVTGDDAIAILQSLLSLAGGKITNKQSTFPDSNGFTFWKWDITKDDQMAQVLRIAETEGVVNILAEPRLMAVNEEKASFKAGQQIPVVKGRDEFGGLLIEYKDSGINIDFTPHILEDSDRILLEIAPEMNEPTPSALSTVDGFPVYGFNTRTTKTKVELQNNETMVIGGLIRNKSDSQKTKYPFLSGIPILGNFLENSHIFTYMFNLPFSTNSTYTKDETELIIFVTPTIIKADAVIDGV